MRRRTAAGSGVDPLAAHLMVRELETSIDTRLAAANESREDQVRADVQADALIAEARVQAAEAGRVHAEAILAAARAEAALVEVDGERAAAELTAAAARQRDDDVAAVLAGVLRRTEVN